jgi:NADPH:quinone reductase-like Zn-dependent oxidoreductase
MKAVRIRSPGGLHNLEVTEAPEPHSPGPGEICVRIGASSLNYHDYVVVTGQMPSADGRIPLSDGCGEVVAVGEAVTGISPGDRVISRFFPHWDSGHARHGDFAGIPGELADGFAREHVTAPAGAFTKAPAGYSQMEGATLVCAGLTAWRALFVDGELVPGDVVLVLGTGGVSTFAVLFAKAAGAVVIVTSSSDEKLARMKSLGADHVINYKSEPKWGSAVRNLTGGAGADHIIELGGAETLSQSISAARVGGHIAIIGALAGLKGPVPTHLILRKQLRVQGLRVGTRVQQQDMVRAIESSGIKPVIDRTFPLVELADAFRYQERAQHLGKIGISI